eukprot:5756294-Amphidinium_carterae.1
MLKSQEKCPQKGKHEKRSTLLRPIEEGITSGTSSPYYNLPPLMKDDVEEEVVNWANHASCITPSTNSYPSIDVFELAHFWGIVPVIFTALRAW